MKPRKGGKLSNEFESRYDQGGKGYLHDFLASNYDVGVAAPPRAL